MFVRLAVKLLGRLAKVVTECVKNIVIQATPIGKSVYVYQYVIILCLGWFSIIRGNVFLHAIIKLHLCLEIFKQIEHVLVFVAHPQSQNLVIQPLAYANKNVHKAINMEILIILNVYALLHALIIQLLPILIS